MNDPDRVTHAYLVELLAKRLAAQPQANGPRLARLLRGFALLLKEELREHPATCIGDELWIRHSAAYLVSRCLPSAATEQFDVRALMLLSTMLLSDSPEVNN